MGENGVDEMKHYDSLFHEKIKDHVKMKICNMYKFFEEKLSVNVRVCQQQSNHVGCGVYTVENKFHLLSEVNISTKRICKDQMRSRLLK